MFNFLFGRSLQQRCAELEQENHLLQSKLTKAEQTISRLNQRSDFHVVAKDFELGPKMYSEVVRRLQEELRPILSDAAFHMLLNARLHDNAPKVHHSMASSDPISCKLTHHRFHIPEYNAIIKVLG